MTFDATAGRILIQDNAGETVLDTDRQTLHWVGYMSGTQVLPRIERHAAGQPVNDAYIATEFTLGSASGAEVLGGNWRLSNAEGLGYGEILHTGNDVPFTLYERRRHRYAPRRLQNQWFPIGGLIVLDKYQFLYSVNPFTIATSGSNVPEVGRLWQTMQFVIDGGNVKLIRRGVNLAHEYIYLTLGAFPSELRLAFSFDCAALTIDYQIWLGRFT